MIVFCTLTRFWIAAQGDIVPRVVLNWESATRQPKEGDFVRVGLSVWNFCESSTSLKESVSEFAGYGFDAVSFLPKQITDLDPPEALELVAVVESGDLHVTIHGTCDLSREDIETIVKLFDYRLKAITVDAAMTSDSRGFFFDTPKIARVLVDIEAASRGTEARFGVEDFPLDTQALEYYGKDLSPVIESPRFGALIDFGHMNLRLNSSDYFRGLGPVEYVGRVPVPVIEVHVHDNDGEADSHGHLGFGSISFDRVVEALKAIAFDGVSTIEIAPTFHDSTISDSKALLKDSLRQWRALCREL